MITVLLQYRCFYSLIYKLHTQSPTWLLKQQSLAVCSVCEGDKKPEATVEYHSLIRTLPCVYSFTIAILVNTTAIYVLRVMCVLCMDHPHEHVHTHTVWRTVSFVDGAPEHALPALVAIYHLTYSIHDQLLLSCCWLWLCMSTLHARTQPTELCKYLLGCCLCH